MTRLHVFVLSCLFPLAMCQAQNSGWDYSVFYNREDSMRHAYWRIQAYPQAVAVLRVLHREYQVLDESLRAQYRWLDAATLYNIACAYSLQDSIEPALNALRRSIDEGFTDYATMSADADLKNLHGASGYEQLLASVKERGDYLYVLQKTGGYIGDENRERPKFTYQTPADSNLQRLRHLYNLDSVAGSGPDVDQIVRLMKWAHKIVRHDGNSTNPSSRNAIDLIQVCEKENRGVNCRMMATILNEAYLAMGFSSRHVTCMPKDTADHECHVITIVYAPSQQQWLWMDPTFEGYVTDDAGRFLGVAEVRERLRNGDSVAAAPELNWNGKPYDGGSSGYLKRYMAKNLYWFSCPVSSEFGYESKSGQHEYVHLYPGDYNPFRRDMGRLIKGHDYYTNDADYFWSPPEKK